MVLREIDGIMTLYNWGSLFAEATLYHFIDSLSLSSHPSTTIGIAYFANLLCKPFNLCYPPGGAVGAPDLGVTLEPGTKRRLTLGADELVEAFARNQGVQVPEVPQGETDLPRVSLQDIQSQLRAAGITPKRGAPTVPAASVMPKNRAERICAPFRGSPGTYQACMKANSSNFAEAESYYVKLA